jgi:tRNA A-37 threonylcarbamoyl transferase component Bud32
MTHDPEWGRLERLFDEGIELPAPEREAWLDRTCPDDARLRERLRRMFAAHESPGLLDRPLGPAKAEGLEARAARALADRYVIESTLGIGGMSAVFRAQERKHERPVVLKVMQPAIAAAMGEGRFLDEVRIAARLSHPHILTLIDSGMAEGLFYYVMPFVEGGESLRERLARDGARPLTEAVALLRDVADALAHAHAAGIVHRDLKPDNVLCVGGHAFLIDFGVAKLEADVTRPHATEPGLPIGTPGYMAPEQAAGQSVDHRADLYAWGADRAEARPGGAGSARVAVRPAERRPPLPLVARRGVPRDRSRRAAADGAVDRRAPRWARGRAAVAHALAALRRGDGDRRRARHLMVAPPTHAPRRRLRHRPDRGDAARR